MKQIYFELESLCALKMDRWLDEDAPKGGADGYKKQAVLKVYKNDKGVLAIPSCALKACIRDASADIGKKMESKKRKQVIKSMVFVEPDFLAIGKKEPDAIAEDVVTRMGTGSKVTRVVTFRPLIKSWKASGTINLFFDAENQENFIKECVTLAGIKYGLLSHRPEFGRFQITKWEVQNAKKTK